MYLVMNARLRTLLPDDGSLATMLPPYVRLIALYVSYKLEPACTCVCVCVCVHAGSTAGELARVIASRGAAQFSLALQTALRAPSPNMALRLSAALCGIGIGTCLIAQLHFVQCSCLSICSCVA